GYKPVRADHLGKPGIITSQVIEHLIDDPLVIADLTGSNANVFYELALRHAVRKPVIQMVHQGERLPFDVAPARTIGIDHRNLDSVAACIKELDRQIQYSEEHPDDIDSPVSVAVDLRALRGGSDPNAKVLSQILSQIQDLQSGVQALSAPAKMTSPGLTYPPPGFTIETKVDPKFWSGPVTPSGVVGYFGEGVSPSFGTLQTPPPPDLRKKKTESGAEGGDRDP
ncbi:MAG: hypothetical protein L3J96_00375, partial [Thermoplasmata archaeon]|nr:hypothetical protein [Thermoplasmata archaeon]